MKILNNPIYLALLTITSWAFGALLFRLITKDTHDFSVLNFSMFIGTLGVLVIAIKEYKNNFWSTLKKIPWYYYLIGLLGYFVFFILMTICMRLYNNASEPSILNYTWPLFNLIFLAIIAKGSLSTNKTILGFQIFGMLFGFLGVLVLFTKGDIYHFNFTNQLGFIMGIGAGLSYGLYSAFTYKVPSNLSTMQVLVAITTSLLANIILSVFVFDKTPFIPSNTHSIYLAIVYGLVVDAIGYVAWARAKSISNEKNINITKVLSLIYFLPLISIFLISVFLGEKLWKEGYFLVSLAIVFASFLLCKSEDISVLLKFKK